MKDLIKRLEEARYASKAKSASQAPEADAEYIDSIMKKAHTIVKDQAKELARQLGNNKFLLDQFKTYRNLSDVHFSTLEAFNLVSRKEQRKFEEIQGKYDFELDFD